MIGTVAKDGHALLCSHEMRHERYDRTEYNGEMEKKNTYSPEFKSKVVLELFSGQHTLNELPEKHQKSIALTDIITYMKFLPYGIRKKNELKNNQGILGHYYRRGTYPTQHNTEPEIFQRRKP